MNPIAFKVSGMYRFRKNIALAPVSLHFQKYFTSSPIVIRYSYKNITIGTAGKYQGKHRRFNSGLPAAALKQWFER